MENHKSIKVVFDYQIFIRQHFGGISRVFAEVNTRLRRNNVKIDYPVLFSQNYYFKDIIHTSEWVSKSGIINYLLRIVNKIYFIGYMIRNHDCNIIHATYYSSYFYYFIPKNTKYVLTVHDCTQELCSKNTLGNKRMCLLKKKAINRADAIIVPSENTKKDIISLYQVKAEKIHVIYWGCTRKKININNIHINLPDKYVLYVGARNDYKNFDNFAKAMGKVCEKIPDIKVVCVGGEFSKEEVQYLKWLHLESNFIQIKANDDELNYLYEKALCFVYPSRYEGFGIPILEAFSCGCPVLLSNASCFPEIGGDSVIYFDPENTADMGNCIYDCIINENERKKMSEQGKQRAREFSWERTARKVYEVYRELVKQ